MKMTLWRTRFERINFGYDPVLYQMADVVFKCSLTEKEARLSNGSPQDDNSITKLSDAAWKAVWEQNPHWEDPAGPTKKISDGWSSVMGGYGGSKYFIVKAAKEDMSGRQFPQRRTGEYGLTRSED